MRRLVPATLLVLPVGAFAAAPDTGWGTLLFGGAIIVLGVLTAIAAVTSFAFSSGWKAVAVACLPVFALVVLPSLYSGAYGLAHRALESHWERTSAAYVAASCASATTKALIVDRDETFGVLVPTVPKVDLYIAVDSTDGILSRVLLRFAYGDEADRLNRERFQTPLMRLPFYRYGSWRPNQVVDYVEEVHPESVVRSAHRKYWTAHESSIPPGQIRPDQLIGAPTELLQARVPAAIATHALQIVDASTATDRQNWTARVHAKLVNRATGSTDAEYVGLIPILPSFPATREVYRTCGGRTIRAWRGSGLDWSSHVLAELATRG